MIWLSKAQIIHLQSRLISKTGGDTGIRDEKILESSINSPLQTFDGKELYPSTLEKIVRLSYCLTCNHPFVDGNKRIGALVLQICLTLNEIKSSFSNEDISSMYLSLASGNTSFKELVQWVEDHLH